jgi:gluconokinase
MPSVVVMGVSGSGKTTFGRALAAQLGVRFLDADDFHPPENVARMAAGIPLTDADRGPWLERLAGLLPEVSTVLACSALKRRYRDRLRAGCPDLRYVFLTAPEAVLAARMAARRDHYMPPSLLRSQLDALEPPEPDEGVLTLDCREPPDTMVAAAAAVWCSL